MIGNFEVGKEFDALLINTKASDSPFDLFSADNFEVIGTGLMITKITSKDVGKICGTARINLLGVIQITGIRCNIPLLSVFSKEGRWLFHCLCLVFGLGVFLQPCCPQ